MSKILHLVSFLFVCISISVAAHDHPKPEQGANCHESCKAQHPDVNSPKHKECMDQCTKGDQK